MKKYFTKLSTAIIILILVTNCKNDKKMTSENKATPNKIDLCITKQKDLKPDIIFNNINTIKGEKCIDKVLDYLKTNFTKSPQKSIEIIEILIDKHEYEYLMDYTNELFLSKPRIFIDYFKEKPQSSIKLSLKELYSNFTPKYSKDTYKKIQASTRISDEDKEILATINQNIK